MRIMIYLETVKQSIIVRSSTPRDIPSMEELDATVLALNDTETSIRAQRYDENHFEEDEEDSEQNVQVIFEGSSDCKEENFGSQPHSPSSSQQPSPPSSSQPSSQPVQLSKTNFFNKFRVKTEDENGQWKENQYISKFPIDFIFQGSDSEGRLQVRVLDNKGDEAKRYNKKTPFIYYAKDEVFSRDDYERKRKTMLTKNKYFKVSQAEFRVRLTRFPDCFLLVELSTSRKDWFQLNFPHHPKILEFIQIKPLPLEGESYQIKKPLFTYETQTQWFQIDENEDFYPETGMFQFDDTEK